MSNSSIVEFFSFVTKAKKKKRYECKNATPLAFNITKKIPIYKVKIITHKQFHITVNLKKQKRN